MSSPEPNSQERPVRVSFEFFPPRTDAMQARLWDTVRRLEPMAPSFVSVTYGAGGSTRERTHETVRRIVSETSLSAAAHLTCVSATRSEVLAVADDYWQAGVRHIVALRGDPPGGIGSRYEPHPDGFADSVDLVRGLRKAGSWRFPYPVTLSFIPKIAAGTARYRISGRSRRPALTGLSRNSSSSRTSISSLQGVRGKEG